MLKFPVCNKDWGGKSQKFDYACKSENICMLDLQGLI